MIHLNAGLGPPISYPTYFIDYNNKENLKWNWRYRIKVSEDHLRNTHSIFIHIPKTGGTSINKRYKYGTNPYITCLGHCFANVYPKWCREKMYTIVRNPYSRLVSSYKFMKRGGFHNNPEYKILIEKFPTFEEWILNGISKIEEVYDHTSIVTELLIPQFCFIYDCSKIKKLLIPENHILRFENYTRDIETHFKISKSDQMWINITQKDKDEWKRYYRDKEVQDKVYRLYIKDFKIFGYSYDI